MSYMLKYRLEYWGLRGVSFLVRILPRSLALTLGAALGRAAVYFVPARYQLARTNMTRALPELSAAEVEKNVKENFAHFGRSTVEMLRLDTLTAADLDRLFDIEGLEHLRQAYELGRGVILLTAHLGFWEAGAFVIPTSGYPCDMVAKKLKNPLADAFFGKLRTAFGGEILESRKGARRIVKSLSRGHTVAVLLDQHAPKSGSVETVFFGMKARTTTVITSMATRYQVPVVPMFCLRQPDNRYRAWTEPMLILEGDSPEEVAANTQKLTDIIESAIRRDVTQWFWMHRRWRDGKRKKVKKSRQATKGKQRE